MVRQDDFRQPLKIDNVLADVNVMALAPITTKKNSPPLNLPDVDHQ